MRPVNLIPAEERRDVRKPMRGGPLAYIVLGALLAALGAVILLVVTNNQISSRTTELAELKQETASAEAKATELAAYIQFHSISTQRTATVSNLANSRFDWEQVMRQLSLVLPSDVWLTNLTGTVRPDVSVASGESIEMRASVPGPALSLVGCGTDQEAVAGFVTVLKDIDGVTRVGVQSSKIADSGGGEESGSVPASGGCKNRTAQFQIVVAFDAAPIPAAVLGETEVAATPPPEESSESEPSTTTASEGE